MCGESERASRSDSPGKRRSRLGSNFSSTKRDRYVSPCPPVRSKTRGGFNVVARRNERRFSCVTGSQGFCTQASPNGDPPNCGCGSGFMYLRYVGFLLRYTATAISGTSNKQQKQSLLHTVEYNNSASDKCHSSVRIVRIELRHIWIFIKPSAISTGAGERHPYLEEADIRIGRPAW